MEPAGAVLLAGFVSATVCTVSVALFGVLMPRAIFGFNVEEVERYPTWRFVTQQQVTVAA